MLSSLERESDETENSYVEASRVSEGKLNKVVEAENKIDQLQKAVQSLEEKLRSVEAENQILRKLAFSDPTIKHTREEPLIPKNVHNLEINFLINCVSKKMGFSQGKPIAAITIYRCLLHWKSFEAERTTVFDHLITMIGNAIKDQESNEHLAYWLSNTTYLLHLLQLNLKVPGIVDTITREKPPTPTLLRRMAQGFRSFSSSSIVVDELDLIQQVEAKYPALLFKQQLPAYMEKIYGIIRDNVKKEMESLLALCIQYVGSAWDELQHIRQAVGFLVIFQKNRISLDEIIHDLCPGLSTQQLYRICSQYWDDKYNTEGVSPIVFNSMRIFMIEDSNTAPGSAFLLDDNSSIPFSVEEVSNSLKEKEFIDVEPPEELLQNPAFQFLKK